MADDAKADEVVGMLRESFAQQIRDAVRDLPAHQALQLADTLCSVQVDLLAGMRVTYKARRALDGAAITEDWRTGLTLPEIMRKHGVSRAAAYKYHPAGVRKRVRHA